MKGNRKKVESLREELRKAESMLQKLVEETDDTDRDGMTLIPDAAWVARREAISRWSNEIQEIKNLIAATMRVNAETDPGVVDIGSVVTISYEDGDEETLTVVLGMPRQDEVTFSSPLGKALEGAFEGAQRSFKGPNGDTFRFKVVSVT